MRVRTKRARTHLYVIIVVRSFLFRASVGNYRALCYFFVYYTVFCTEGVRDLLLRSKIKPLGSGGGDYARPRDLKRKKKKTTNRNKPESYGSLCLTYIITRCVFVALSSTLSTIHSGTIPRHVRRRRYYPSIIIYIYIIIARRTVINVARAFRSTCNDEYHRVLRNVLSFFRKPFTKFASLSTPCARSPVHFCLVYADGRSRSSSVRNTPPTTLRIVVAYYRISSRTSDTATAPLSPFWKLVPARRRVFLFFVLSRYDDDDDK